jgi:hypothetical protein
MKIALGYLVVGACLTGISVAQTPAQPQAPPPQMQAQPQAPLSAPTSATASPIAMQFSPGTLIRVALEKPVDSKKAQVGEQVIAKTTDDLKSVPPGLATKGCQIIGHVVEVTPHQGDPPSTIRIVFDKMILKNNSEMALPATIKAVGFVDQFNPATDIEAVNRMGGTAGGSGTAGGTGLAGSQSQGTNTIGAGGGNPGMYGGGRMPSAGSSGSGYTNLPFNAQGAIGMSGVTLSAGTAQDSILTAKKKNVKLDSGMQMILKTN